nr:RNA-dependent RNA polymerase [Chuviridae sp.]
MDLSQKQLLYSPSELVFDRKLNVALRDSHGKEFVKRHDSRTYTKDDEMLLYHLSVHHKSLGEYQVNTNIFPSIFLNIISLDSHVSNKTALRRYIHLIRNVLLLQHDALFENQDKNLGLGITTFIDESLTALSKHRALKQTLYYSSIFENLVTNLTLTEVEKYENELLDVFKLRRARHCKCYMKEIDLLLIWSRNTVFISYQDHDYVFPRSFVLLIHNKLSDIVSVLLLASCYPETFFGCHAYDSTIRFIKCYMRLANRYDQKFFHISKVLEALVIGESLAQLEGRNNEEFLETVIDGIYSSSRFRYEGSQLQQILRSHSIPLIHEFSCLSKIAGHPFCDIKGGAGDLKKKVKEERLINLGAVHQSIRYAKEHFVRSFLHKHSRWPIVHIEPEAASLMRACLKGNDPRSISHQRKYGVIKIEDYDALTLGKNMEFDWIENFIPYIKDRTISLVRSKVMDKYLNETETHTEWQETRVLLAYLLWPEQRCDHMTYLQAYIAGDWDTIRDYLIIRVVPKEKEHKVNARGFGCKSMWDRARSIIQEVNAAEFLDNYSEEHAMTQGEIPLMRKLYAFRHLQKAYKGYKMILINVDASAWNNRFRHEAVAPLMGETMDRIYDVPIFSKTHLAYQNSFVYMPDAGTCYWWDGQEGGIEGLNQDTWVITYISQIKVCMEEFPFPYHILCKGDDLRVAVMIPPSVLHETTLDTLKTRILSGISSIGEKFGHMIKIEDSYASESYFAFSKDTYIKNAEMSQGYRKIQKCYGANNAFINTLDDHIASSFSNAHSASKVSPSPLSCYVVALFWGYHYLLKHPSYSELSDHELTACMLIPNILGGFPVIYLHNFFIRAESDLLTSYIQLVQYTRVHHQELYISLFNSFCQRWDDPLRCITGLCIDPYSLPIVKPPMASSILRKSVIKLVEKHTKNKTIKELFKARNTGFMKTFTKILSSSNIYNAKIMSALYAVTPDGIITELIRKFESGRSIYEMMILQSGRRRALRVLGRVKRADNRVHQHRIALIKRTISRATFPPEMHQYLDLCSTECCQNLRDFTWEKRVVGVTQPAIHHMITVGDISHFPVNMHTSNNHFEYRFNTERKMNDYESILFSGGEEKPFLGATTGTGLGDPEAKLISKNIFALKLHNLLDVYRWSFCTIRTERKVITSNLPELIEDMIRQYTGKEVHEVAPYTSKRVLDKTIQHHVRANQYRASIVPNTLINIYTRSRGYSFSHLRFCDDLGHYLINFHQAYCHAVSLFWYNGWCGLAPIQAEWRIWACTTECNYCMTPIIDHPTVLELEPLPSIEIHEISELSASALQQIQKELEDYAPRSMFICSEESEHFTKGDASSAVIQHLINSTMIKYAKTRDHYTQHEISAGGKDVLLDWGGTFVKSPISMTDVRQLPLRSIFEDACILISFYIIRRQLRITPETGLSTISAIPANDHEWIGLIQLVDSAGLLYDLQSHLMSQYPEHMSSVFESYTSFSAMFGYICYLHALKTPIPPVLYVLSVDNNAYLPHDIKRRISVYQRHIIMLTERKLYRHVRKLAPIRHLHLAYRILFLAWIKEWEEDKFELDEIKNIKSLTVPVFQFEDYDTIVEGMPLWIEDHTEWSTTLPLLVYEFTDLPYEQAMIGIADEENLAFQVYGEIAQEYSQYTIELKRTDLVSCQNIIGSQQSRTIMVEEKEFENGHALHFPFMNTLNFDVIRRGLDLMTYARNPIEYEEMEYPEPPPIGLDEGWNYKTVGLNNISSSRLLYLLQCMGVYALPHDSNYLCLADGYGGYANVIAHLVTGSTIVYNTKPLTPESFPKPIGALKTAEARQNTIDWSALSAGHYDLHKEETYKFFEEYTKCKYTLITCDLELVVINNLYYDILFKVITFCLRNLIARGTFIIKAYGVSPNQVNKIVGSLIPYCYQLTLCKSPASAGKGEFYFLGQVTPEQEINPLTTLTVRYPSGTICGRIHGFLHELRRSYTVFDPNMRLYANDITHQRLKDVIHRMECYGWSKLAEVTKVSISNVHHLRNGRSTKDWTWKIITLLKPILKRYTAEIKGEVNIPVQYDTLAHKYVMGYRYIQLYAFNKVFEMFHRTEQAYLTEIIIRTDYEIMIKVLPDTLRIPAAFYLNPYIGHLMPVNKEINFFNHYMAGLKWGWSALCYGQ